MTPKPKESKPADPAPAAPSSFAEDRKADLERRLWRILRQFGIEDASGNLRRQLAEEVLRD